MTLLNQIIMILNFQKVRKICARSLIATYDGVRVVMRGKRAELEKLRPCSVRGPGPYS